MSNHYSLKAGKPLSWSRDWDGLQVVHDQNADGLQAVGDQTADGLQALYRNSNQGYPGYNSPSQIGTNGEKGGTRRICGLRATSFWLVCVIVILIVGGGVGGGIGGWLASRKLDYSISSQTPPNTATPTPTSTKTISTTTSTTSVSTPASTSTSISTDICPSANGTTLTETLGSLKYRIICDSDFSGSGKITLSSIVLATFDQCLSFCNTMNYFQSRTDVGCTYNVQGTGSQTPGTCWCLGGENKTIVSDVGNVIAVPM
ncbi:uncharacterized protein BHQ10_006402 [Talaromyces amestolkiae]|uniref:Apple domain-containing protein n=1 Tax=Talaromyces amestolkiae TaxID=1196081 RepID=A0A364L3K2_TALAM|nr:uncharacterized protein BHQ10_006402 [Talaromyces amestolkiae]RAO70390.1 hypothetical protein BHQ10_006402 [Talaromyces amestolkiae]